MRTVMRVESKALLVGVAALVSACAAPAVSTDGSSPTEPEPAEELVVGATTTPVSLADPLPADDGSVPPGGTPRIGDVYEIAQAGPRRGSLSPDPSTSTAHVHRLVEAGDALLAVGSAEHYSVGSWPTVWRIGDASGVGSSSFASSPEIVPGTTTENGSAIDAVVGPDGTVLVLGWLSGRSGPRTVVWEMANSAQAPLVEVRRFDTSELGGVPDRLVVDGTGRIWIVAREHGLDGWLGAATEIDGEWRVLRLIDGLVGFTSVVPGPSGLDVIASWTTYDDDGTATQATWDHWELAVTGTDPAVMSRAPLGVVGVIADAERYDGALHMLGRSDDGTIALWTQQEPGGPWATLPLPAFDTESPLALARVGDDVVALVTGPETDGDRSAGRAIRVSGAAAEAWSGPFSIDFLSAGDSADYPATVWRDTPVLLDRSVVGDVSAVTLTDEGADVRPLGIGPLLPSWYERVDDLQLTDRGVFAIVSRVDGDGAGAFLRSEYSLYLLEDGVWNGLASGYIDAWATWQGSPLWVSSAGSTVDVETLTDGEIAMVGTFDVPGVVDDVAVVGDRLVVSAQEGGVSRAYVGAVGGPLDLVDGFEGEGVTVREICDNSDMPLLVVESADGDNQALLAIDDVGPVEGVGLPPALGGQARPFCWQAADGSVRLMADLGLLSGASAPVTATVEPGLAGPAAIALARELPLDLQLFDVATDGSGYAVGRSSDRWGEWDAAVVQWLDDVPTVVATFGGNGRQEARTVLRVQDGWLFGGTDNGEAVVWKLEG